MIKTDTGIITIAVQYGGVIFRNLKDKFILTFTILAGLALTTAGTSATTLGTLNSERGISSISSIVIWNSRMAFLFVFFMYVLYCF